jgi:hypothetical protein
MGLYFVFTSLLSSTIWFIYSFLFLLKLKYDARRMRWAGHVARMGEGRGAYRIFVGLPEGKRPLERPRRRWEDNIKMDLQDVGWGMDWIDMAQNRKRWWLL